MTITDAITTIKSSVAPKELLRAAAELAQSNHPDAHNVLRAALNSSEFLYTLNSPEEHEGSTIRLRVRRILDTLSTNPSPVAVQTLLSLTRSRAFLGDEARIELLITATSEIRPAPPELVAFWNTYSQPDDGFTHMTIETLIYNTSPPALELFENKMRDSSHEFEDKCYWLRDNVMPKRNVLEIVQSAERLLRDQALDEDLRLELVDILYDYKADWFNPEVRFSAPALESYPDSVKATLSALADYVLRTIPLDEKRRKVLKKALNDLQFDNSPK